MVNKLFENEALDRAVKLIIALLCAGLLGTAIYTGQTISDIEKLLDANSKRIDAISIRVEKLEAEASFARR